MKLRIIPNTENRLEVFRQLFTWMITNKFASVNGNYVVVDANVNLTPKDNTQRLFSLMQQHGRISGFSYLLYEIKL